MFILRHLFWKVNGMFFCGKTCFYCDGVGVCPVTADETQSLKIKFKITQKL